MEVAFNKGRLTKVVKVGYSWTVGLFGPIPLAMRGMWGWAIFTGIANLLTWGLAGLVIGAFANKAYAQSLVDRGWEPDRPSELPDSWEIAK